MKKILVSMLIAITSLTLTCYAATGKIVNGRTFVPVRGAFEELGFDVVYDNTTATAIISDGNYTIKIPKGKSYFDVNGKSIKPDSPQTIIDGSMYLPLRAIGDSIGASTDWDNNKKVAHISYNGKNTYVYCGSQEENNSIKAQKSNSISAPLGKESQYSRLFEDGRCFGFYADSADGIHVGLITLNNSGKTIKYITVYYAMFNSVNDACCDEITGEYIIKQKTVGPIYPGSEIALGGRIAYSGVCIQLLIPQLEVEYMDGTSEVIDYLETAGIGYETYYNKYHNNFYGY